MPASFQNMHVLPLEKGFFALSVIFTLHDQLRVECVAGSYTKLFLDL